MNIVLIELNIIYIIGSCIICFWNYVKLKNIIVFLCFKCIIINLCYSHVDLVKTYEYECNFFLIAGYFYIFYSCFLYYFAIHLIQARIWKNYLNYLINEKEQFNVVIPTLSIFLKGEKQNMGKIFLLLIIIGVVVYRIVAKYKDVPSLTKPKTIYKEKSLMTNKERYFYNILRELEPSYKIIPQVNLASVITKMNNKSYFNDLFRNIDFAILNSDLSRVLLLIEIDDETHNSYKRIKRDNKVNKICKDANIKLIHFYTKYSNNKNYVQERVMKELSNKDV